MQPIVLTHWRSPGDTVCMTACVRDLAIQYPRRYEIHIAGSCSPIWQNNPHVAKVWGPKPPSDLRRVRLSCTGNLVGSDRVPRHYLAAFHGQLQSQMGIELPVLYPRGDLYLSDVERTQPLAEKPYWLVVAGGKADIPVKIWSQARYQALVYALRERGIKCVQGGALLPGHHHPRLEAVESFVGRTDMRGFLRLIYHADGIICPVTFAMHAAAAFEKPCVVIAGGREPWWWAAYVNSRLRHFGRACSSVRVPHRFLHTIGNLDCCRITGCWKTQLAGIEQITNSKQCILPVEDGNRQVIPRCLEMIEAKDVERAVLDYANDQR